MKTMWYLFSLAIIICIISCPVRSAQAFQIDGNLDDWGINSSADMEIQGYFNTHTPTSATAQYYTNDQIDNSWNGGYTSLSPGYTYGGTYHGIYYLANAFDAEAIYFDNDATDIYLAVVTGTPFSGAKAPGNQNFRPGDIAIGTVAGAYNFAIDLSSYNKSTGTAHVYEDNGNMWNPVAYGAHSDANPWTVNTLQATDKGEVEFAYSDEFYGHYVMESKIPLSLLGLDGLTANQLWTHWTMECGNNAVDLAATTTPGTNPVPEPMSMFLLGPALLGLLMKHKKNQLRG